MKYLVYDDEDLVDVMQFNSEHEKKAWEIENPDLILEAVDEFDEEVEEDEDEDDDEDFFDEDEY